MSVDALQMEKAWSATFVPGNENEEGVRQLLDAKAHWEALGLQFPTQFFVPRLSGKPEDRAAFQAQLRIVNLLGDARRTVRTFIVVTNICQDGMPEATPSFTMEAEFSFLDSTHTESDTGG